MLHIKLKGHIFMKIQSNNDLKINKNPSKGNLKGILFSLGILTVFVSIYILSIVITLSKKDSGFMYRAWTWTEYFIGACSLYVIIKKYKGITLRFLIIGFIFTLISSLSFFFRTNLSSTLPEAFILFSTFLGGCLLADGKIRSSLVNRDLKNTLISIGMGSLIAIPLAILNLLYFKNTLGPSQLQSPIFSAFLALQPGISEEIIFRFFVINGLLTILSKYFSRKSTLIISFFFAIVPHSLVHLSELWLINPIEAISLLLLTSLFFGLPMAYLQYKRDLETAISFHWFIDFIRFFGGY